MGTQCVDCVLLIGPDFLRDEAALAELEAGLPVVNMELVDQDAFQRSTGNRGEIDDTLNWKSVIILIVF